MLSVITRAKISTDWDRRIAPDFQRRAPRSYVNTLFSDSLANDVCRLASRLRRRWSATLAEADTPETTQPSLSQPLPWAEPEPPEQVDALSAFYVERPSDTIALRSIQGQGVTLTIKGPGQVGKTSLLTRISSAARQCGKRVATVDLQILNPRTFQDGQQFFKTLCDVVSSQLGVEPCADAFWGHLGDSYTCTRYFEQHLLQYMSAPLVLTIDKLDRIPNAALRADLFAMLRAWATNRATNALWSQLDLVLATSIDPRHLAHSSYQSPFNSTETIVLDDFTPAQVGDLNERHGRPFAAAQERALVVLLNGHPYLTRRALYLVAAGHYTAADLLARAHEDDGPFGEHLRLQLFKLYRQERHAVALRQILLQGNCADEPACQNLHSAGLVRRDCQRTLPRCRLYSHYFRTHL
jgi:hypothetical protein